ncbi:DEAD/DEAH box helicase [Erysipelothrix sp. HDW6A]|uniref:DEAD/DEAH box helicase n=1 Tax=Erysipelothrix sp. HDW6A TaxID=2714928 RepID=UPI00140A2AE7|nr:DEAD/DEAH box helicase [Erysipelothrix sp. HDW6A]QIK56842.1 DEAD/DEAH box helicase [Erysipelothrix sp. HDW6A]
MAEFKQFGLSEPILEALNVLGYSEATEVQEILIPRMKEGNDFVVLSETGSGKTAAFGIPLVDATEWEIRTPQAMVIAPTRELAMQIKEEIFNIARYKRLSVACLIGKDSMSRQAQELKQRCHIVVGTPGRIFDHIERGNLDLEMCRTLVIDEADELLRMGFRDQVTDIVGQLTKHQTILLSATMNDDVQHLINTIVPHNTLLEVASDNPVEERINHYGMIAYNDNKNELLLNYLESEMIESAIIFCNMKVTVNDVYNFLKNKGLNVDRLHGDRDQKDRTQTLKDFKQGKIRYVVATDVAARGLDIDKVPLIVNYDLPEHEETYVHRTGRTARKDETGKALTLLFPYQEKHFYTTYPFANSLEGIIFEENPAFMALQKKKRDDIKQDVSHQDIMKLHIKGGRKQKIRPGDIVGAITGISKVDASDIGVIQVLDESSYVEILNDKGRYVMKSLERRPIKGKIRRVEKAYE